MAHPILQTDRLELRIATPDEAEIMLRYMARNADFHAPFNPPTPPDFLTFEFWQRQTQRNLDGFEAGTSARLSVWLRDDPRGEMVGQCNLSNIIQGAFWACHLGYSIDEHRQKNGYMTEAIGAVIRFAFDDLNLHRIMANYMPDNAGSAAVLRKHGFVIEGNAKDYLLIGGQWRDHVLTSLTNPNWRTPY